VDDEDQDYFILVIGVLAAILAILAIVILLGTRLGIGVAADNGETIISGDPAEEEVVIDSAERTTALVTLDDESVTLTGVVATEELRDDLVSRAEGAVGEENVTDELTVDPAADPETGVVTLRGSGGSAAVAGLGAGFLTVDDDLGLTLNDQLTDGAPAATSPATVETTVPATTPATTAPATTIPERPSLEIELEELFSLNPIQFDTASANIRGESAPTLDEAVTLIQADETLDVSIEGHTDSQGDDVGNQALSQARAESVQTYLANGGVAPERLTATGFGETQLKIDPEVTPEDFEMNRRIEFKVSSDA